MLVVKNFGGTAYHNNTPNALSPEKIFVRNKGLGNYPVIWPGCT
jgi:hypothetical protein